ncbi:hypothetical protein, partial [Enterovibrio norvegicus]|uniref:hypothetical protein n=2 Tax=Enterovibrio TaxID=188143 RepID=UPI00354F822D
AIQYTSVPSSTDVVTLSVSLDEFTDASGSGDLSRDAIAQIVITASRADSNESVDVYLDNIYFSK